MDKHNTDDMLRLAERTTQESASALPAPRSFLVVFVLLAAATGSLYGMIPTALWAVGLLLYVPIIIWYVFWSRRRTAKPRTVLTMNSKFEMRTLGLLAASQLAIMYTPESWAVAGIKFVVVALVFAGLLYYLIKQEAYSRSKESHEQVH